LRDLKPKKYLGQHFLKDSNISKKISTSLISKSSQTIIEIGPGMGILTQHLISKKTQTYFVELDRSDNVYLLGQSEIQDSTFIHNAQWSVPGSGQFISKLTPSLDSVIYSTVFGSGNGINISPTAFLVDLCNKMYLAGWGGSINNLSILNNNAGSTFNMPITADAFQNSTDGSDFYIMVLEDDASGLVYGSYFGGSVSSEHVDGGTSRFDRKGKVYQAICASCGGSSDLPIEPINALSPTNNSNCNLGVFKMDFNFLSFASGMESLTFLKFFIAFCKTKFFATCV